MLATSADSEGVNRSDPGLFHGGTRQIVGRSIPSGNPCKDIARVAHHMAKVEQERDISLIEVGEIDASGKYPPPGVFWMFHRAASQHSHLGAGIEDREIDRCLQRRQCRFV